MDRCQAFADIPAGCCGELTFDCNKIANHADWMLADSSMDEFHEFELDGLHIKWLES